MTFQLPGEIGSADCSNFVKSVTRDFGPVRVQKHPNGNETIWFPAVTTIQEQDKGSYTISTGDASEVSAESTLQDHDRQGSEDYRGHDPYRLCIKHQEINIPRLLSTALPPGNWCIPLGALEDIFKENRCPLCRLVTHVFKKAASRQLLSEGTFKRSVCELNVVDDEYSRDNDFNPPLEQELDKRSAWIHLRGGKNDRSMFDLVPPHPQDPTFSLPLKFQPFNSKSVYWHEIRQVGAKIKLKLIRDWLVACQHHHGAICGQRLSELEPNRTDFRVIDVATRRVVTAPIGCNYFTLSYVWGPDQAQTFKSLKENSTNSCGGLKDLELPDSLPSTIDDAIYLTQKLEARYLWVDVLCIVQDDEIHKSGQISEMGKIYASSSLTIVAAGGSEVSAPLPGLRSSRYIFQRVENIDGIEVANILPRSKQAIIASTWNQRAWTFQERLLSRSCLIFTRYQVYYQCLQTTWCEEVAMDDFSHQSKATVRNGYFQGILSPFRPIHRAKFFKLYADMVESYTKRKLSVPKDMVKAFEGALMGLGTTYNLSFHHGLPTWRLDLALLWQPAGPIAIRKGAISELKMDLVSEEPSEPFCNRLSSPQQINSDQTESHERELELRFKWPDSATFPSWAWAAWQGQVRYEHRIFDISQTRRKLLWLDEVRGRENTYHGQPPPAYYSNPRDCHNSKPDPIGPKGVLEFWTTGAHFCVTSRPKDKGGSRFNDLHFRLHTKRLPAGLRCFLIVDPQRTEAGEIQLHESSSIYDDELCEFVVISHTKEVDRKGWHSGWGGHAFPVDRLDSRGVVSTLPSQTTEWSYFKVMLIKRQDGLAYRIGIGTVHRDAWMSADPTWQHIKLG